MNTRPLEVALGIAKQLGTLTPEEQRAVLLILADLVKATPPEEASDTRKPANPDDIVTYAEAAKRTGVSVASFYAAVRHGRLRKYGTPGRGHIGRVSLAEVERIGMRPRKAKGDS